MPQTDAAAMLRASVSLAVLLLAAAGAHAQGYANAPFRDRPVALAQAAALERIELTARALALGVKPGEDEEGDSADATEAGEEEGGPEADFALFGASLAAVAPDLAKELDTEIEAMLDAVEPAAAAAKVIEITERARGVLLTDADDNPGFRAALMASLLIDEGGVGEAYEAAAEGDRSAYRVGWFALQRVKALWGGMAAQATPAQVSDVATLLGMLDRLFPHEAPPARLSPDPEQAEAPAQQLVGVLEVVTNADLYPGRDLAGAAVRVRNIAAQGCTALEAGEGPLGVESLTIAAAYYASTMEDTLGVMAPAEGEAIAGSLEALKDGAPAGLAADCGLLLEALTAGRAALTP